MLVRAGHLPLDSCRSHDYLLRIDSSASATLIQAQLSTKPLFWRCRALNITLAFALGICIPFLAAETGAATRINQEGRILGPLPVLTNAVLFNTSAGDSIISAIQVFPVTSAWNEDISRRPVLTNSDAMIAQIISDLSTSRRTLRVFQEMNYVLVPDAQPAVPINFVDYPDESDPGPYPIPSNLPIEGWPSQTTTNLLQWQ